MSLWPFRLSSLWPPFWPLLWRVVLVSVKSDLPRDVVFWMKMARVEAAGGRSVERVMVMDCIGLADPSRRIIEPGAVVTDAASRRVVDLVPSRSRGRSVHRPESTSLREILKRGPAAVQVLVDHWMIFNRNHVLCVLFGRACFFVGKFDLN